MSGRSGRCVRIIVTLEDFQPTYISVRELLGLAEKAAVCPFEEISSNFRLPVATTKVRRPPCCWRLLFTCHCLFVLFYRTYTPVIRIYLIAFCCLLLL